MFIKYILFILLFKVLFFAKRSASDLKCIKANKWQNLTSSTKTLDYSNTCTSISSSCCYINMTYSYINFDVSSQYCASLSGNLDDFKEYLNNIYQDDVLFFSNYTYRNKANYKYLGRQLDYNYTQNYSCFKAPSKQNYSTYLYNNCGQFDKNGGCLFEKDTYYFSNFTNSFYRNYSEEYCNKLNKEKCLMYNGTKSNNAMVRPLLQDLVGYLHIDEPDYVFDQSDDVVDINPDNEDTITDKWPTGYCKDIPKISLNIVCPNSYVNGNYIKLYKLWIILVILSM